GESHREPPKRNNIDKYDLYPESNKDELPQDFTLQEILQQNMNYLGDIFKIIGALDGEAGDHSLLFALESKFEQAERAADILTQSQLVPTIAIWRKRSIAFSGVPFWAQLAASETEGSKLAKVNESGLTPEDIISENKFKASLMSPFWTYPAIIPFQATKSV
ncbi:hypothetical protein RJ641_017808, partial [Dillenia turbinata]